MTFGMPDDDLKSKVDAQILRLIDEQMPTAKVAAHGTVRPYLALLIPEEERERVAFMAYVRRVVEAQLLRDKQGVAVKDSHGRTIHLYVSTVQHCFDESGDPYEEYVYERVDREKIHPEKARYSERRWRQMLFGLIANFPLLKEETKHECIVALTAILDRAS